MAGLPYLDEENEEKFNAIIIKCVTEKEFRKQFLANPKQVLDEFGITFTEPRIKNVIAVELPDRHTICIPVPAMVSTA